MNNYVGALLKAYYQTLNGNITYNGQEVKVYRTSIDSADNFHYIQLKPESETDSSNKNVFITNPVVIADILTVHDGGIDESIVQDIDNQMRQLLFSSTQITNLIAEAGMQILNVRAESSTYLDGFDGTRYQYRKITRFSNRVLQTT